MTTELVPYDPPRPPALEPAPPPVPFDLMRLILTGLRPQSAEGYAKDYRAWAAFTGDRDACAALWRLLGLEPAAANALALAYQADMEARGLSPATIARRLAALRRAVRRARLAGLTTLSLELEPPRAQAFRDTAGPGAKGWAKLLAAAIAEAAAGVPRAVRDLAILRLLRDRALRRGEVSALDLADVDLDRPAVQVLGKGQTSAEWLTVNEPTRDALAAWIGVRGDWPGPLFTRCDHAGDGRGRLSGWAVNELVGKAAERAGLGRKVRAHALRHEGITAALDAGWDVRDVKHFSRHSKIDTVLIYDDRRKDLGGEITRSIGRPARGRRAGR